ncbi:MAG TPA: endolytic transglycosylase MltG [Miltoncostaeaceae bacterium]|nr:endolytic transglycosylase MltG [Miltoncostaeaceae bacterium]
MSGGRPGRASRGQGGGRTALWILLILVMAVAVGLALAREATKDDTPSAAPAAETAPAQKLLIREGLRREDIARLLDRETAIPGERYLALTAAGQRGRRLAGTSRPTSLEGFLFPATYDITDRTTAGELVDEQLAAYDANTSQVNYAYAKSKNLTKYDVLILASMIEREVAVARERPIVAGVMYNRLKAGMRLDIDATVQYALGQWKPELTASDLAIDSPYNTRRFAGLPPGPISNPGLDSIRAAARPAKVPYLYYVARNDGSGRHFFATTPEEFDRDVAQSEANAGG